MAEKERSQVFYTDLSGREMNWTDADNFPELFTQDGEDRIYLFNWDSLRLDGVIYNKIVNMAREDEIRNPMSFVFISAVTIDEIEHFIGALRYMGKHLLSMRRPVDLSRFSFEIDQIELQRNELSFKLPILLVSPLSESEDKQF